MFKATGMQMCVSKLMMPAVDVKTAFWSVSHIDSIVNSQLPLALKLLVGNTTSWTMLLQALQAMCKVYCCEGAERCDAGSCNMQFDIQVIGCKSFVNGQALS